ncbi:hypothetical protein HMPREF0091_10075 [Fannyhessea vaginae DSM 15829]|uniref:Uncharacterized protein n=1 Tax=Fannyhessea vaginae DSM 15829 TaxID=525256 RepID=F1T5I3_9ACTN|nr:hypothetical protein HMPREF0091_10075 [Fannyhessea vaginae DSM 15829]
MFVHHNRLRPYIAAHPTQAAYKVVLRLGLIFVSRSKHGLFARR